MNFTAPDGSSFTLTIVGYEFPHMEQEPYDSNWLNVRIVATPNYSWSVTEPTMLTYEVARLADWLEAVEEGNPAEDEIGFIEPCLWFKFVRQGVIIKGIEVHFELEYRPEHARTWQMRQKDFFVEFPLSSINLKQATTSLRSQVGHYPQRAER